MKSSKLFRQILIINLLVENPDGQSKSEIKNTIEKIESNFNYLDLTFRRDIKDIRIDFGIELIYNRKDNCYFIDNYTINESKIELLLNSFKIFSSLATSTGLPKYIIPENRKANGLCNFTEISEAIAKNKYIQFDYLKFDTNTIETKKVKPLALKESKNRWYLIGSYENKTEIRSFGLDRISHVFEIDQKFKSKISIADINGYFEDSYAMFTDEKVEKVKLSFDLRDGNYIKSYPIHWSQKCDLDTEKKRYYVTLNIRITLDFIMELLSRSWSVEVIEPLHLRTKIASIFQEAILRNN